MSHKNDRTVEKEMTSEEYDSLLREDIKNLRLALHESEDRKDIFKSWVGGKGKTASSPLFSRLWESDKEAWSAAVQTAYDFGIESIFDPIRIARKPKKKRKSKRKERNERRRRRKLNKPYVMKEEPTKEEPTKEEPTKEEPAKKEPAKKEPAFTVDSVMADMSGEMGQDFKDSFTEYRPTRKDFINFLEEAGDKILIPTYGENYSSRNPLTEMIRGLVTFWTGNSYSTTKANSLKATQALFNWMQVTKQTGGLNLLKNIGWDIPRLATTVAVEAAKVPLNLVKDLIEDTQTAEWLVDKGVISYEMDVSEEFLLGGMRNDFIPLSQFVQENMMTPLSVERKKTNFEKIMDSFDDFTNYLKGNTETQEAYKQMKLTKKQAKRYKEKVNEADYVRDVMDTYFSKYVKANKFHTKRNMRSLISSYIDENKSDLEKTIKDSMKQALSGKYVSHSKTENVNFSIDAVESVIQNSIKKYANTVASKMKDASEEAKEEFLKNLESRDLSKEIASLKDTSVRKINPSLKIDSVETIRGTNEGYSYGTKAENISWKDFENKMKSFSESAKAKQKSYDDIKNYKGVARSVLTFAKEFSVKVLKPLKKMIFGGKEIDKKGPSFEEWAKDKTFTNPRTRNKVKFDSLPSEEQKKIRSDFSKKASELDLRKGLVRVAYEDPSTRNKIISFLFKDAAGWKSLPRGWTEESVKKFWANLTKANKKHPFAECVKKMKGKLENPEAFCASAKDHALGTTKWRGKGRKKKKKKASLDFDRFYKGLEAILEKIKNASDYRSLDFDAVRHIQAYVSGGVRQGYLPKSFLSKYKKLIKGFGVQSLSNDLEQMKVNWIFVIHEMKKSALRKERKKMSHGKSLFQKVVKLAYNNPHIRKDLLPLLKKAWNEQDTALDDLSNIYDDLASLLKFSRRIERSVGRGEYFDAWDGTKYTRQQLRYIATEIEKLESKLGSLENIYKRKWESQKMATSRSPRGISDMFAAAGDIRFLINSISKTEKRLGNLSTLIRQIHKKIEHQDFWEVEPMVKRLNHALSLIFIDFKDTVMELSNYERFTDG